MDLKEVVRGKIEKFFGLPVEHVEDASYTNYYVRTPTGVSVVVIPVRFFEGRATMLAVSEGFGGCFCPLRKDIDAQRGEVAPHPLDRRTKDNYEGGKCPDCGTPIPADAKAGDACANCDHVFW